MNFARLSGVCAAALLLMSGTAGAQIAGTAHDLGGDNPNDNLEICVYCHTPHNSNTGIVAPLWNRTTPAGPYTMYSSPTLDMTIAGAPQGVSLACLSCHDGTLALDALVNFPPGMTSVLGTIPAAGNLTTDLSNDHPISITYDSTQDPDFVAAAGGTVGGTMQLFGPGADQVECGTCHSVHDDTNNPFLRVSNSASAVCLTCHIK